MRPTSVPAAVESALTADAPGYVVIPAGSFEMGCVPTDGKCGDDEKPRHTVRITHAFRLMKAEVTVAQFGAFVAATAYRTTAEMAGWSYGLTHNSAEWMKTNGLSWRTPLRVQEKASGRWPVAQVSWEDATAYCRWAQGRLPTEAEWEYAARGGQEGRLHVWGDQSVPGGRVANLSDESDARQRNISRTSDVMFVGYDDGYAEYAPVASFTPNGYGLFDMAGNVWEWCADWYGVYASETVSDPKGPSSGQYRALRGGSWICGPRLLRVSGRFACVPGGGSYDLGFRCAQDVVP
jgi:formylglycine-generating enzyme required for sulfatase activity